MEVFFVYVFLVFSSLAVIYWKAWKKDPFIRVDWSAFANFVGFMAMMTMLRFCMADIMMTLYPLETASHIQAMSGKVSVAITMFVFWEDIWFVLPIAWIMKKMYGQGKWKSKIAITMVILISTLFGMGHLYQGSLAFIAALYPFFISYHYGKRYGLGTVMLGHMFYDFVTVMTVKSLHLFL